MAFSTLVFPFVFLPVSLILYFVLPKRLKNAALVVCSLVVLRLGDAGIPRPHGAGHRVPLFCGP